MMARIEQSIEVNVPLRTAYEQLTQFEHYPRFMEDLVQVRQLDDKHVHWHSKAGNLDMEWDAEITEQVPERCIAWRNTSEPHYTGRIELQALAPERTRIAVSVDTEHGQQVLAQHGDAERAVAQRAERGLARFRKFLEGLPREGGAGRERAPHEPAASGVEAAGAGGQRREAGQDAQERSWIPNLMQIWDEPLSMMRRMSEEMDQLVGRFIARPAQLYGRARTAAAPPGTWSPAVEVAQGQDKLVICAELPGVRRDDVKVEIKNDRVTIEGERRPAQQSQELQRTERNYGHFYRVIALPEGAEPDAASAALHDGVLEITVPVPEGGKRARRVDIRAQ
ncbi:MAG TPA: Hsp20 family protein [Noviherbaspirillum sp.]|nr:Hsp20 family protein [Noviherbaspirillum sp.]